MAKTTYQSEVSKRYARALFDVFGAQGADKVLLQLRKIQKILGQGEVEKILCSPVLSRSEKKEVLKKALSHENIDVGLETFLCFLSDKDRLQIFSEITSSFEAISDLKNGVLRGVVTSKEELSKEEKSEIEAAISAFTGASLILDYNKSEGMLGGVTAQVGSFTFDGSLDSQLGKLKEQIINNK